MTIGSNMPALRTHTNMLKNNRLLKAAMLRLSSGYKINSAKEDAAGLAISDKLTFQITGLNRASQNASHGVSLVQTAEGALAEVHNMLQRMRELAVQAANGVNNDDDREKMQVEINELIEEIHLVSDRTEFNKIKLLSGEADRVSASYGIDPLTGQRLPEADKKIAKMLYMSQEVPAGTFKYSIDSVGLPAQYVGTEIDRQEPVTIPGRIIINGEIIYVQRGDNYDAIKEQIVKACDYNDIYYQESADNVVYLTSQKAGSLQQISVSGPPELLALFGLVPDEVAGSDAKISDCQMVNELGEPVNYFNHGMAVKANGNQITVTGSSGEEIRFNIQAILNETIAADEPMYIFGYDEDGNAIPATGTPYYTVTKYDTTAFRVNGEGNLSNPNGSDVLDTSGNPIKMMDINPANKPMVGPANNLILDADNNPIYPVLNADGTPKTNNDVTGDYLVDDLNNPITDSLGRNIYLTIDVDGMPVNLSGTGNPIASAPTARPIGEFIVDKNGIPILNTGGQPITAAEASERLTLSSNEPLSYNVNAYGELINPDNTLVTDVNGDPVPPLFNIDPADRLSYVVNANNHLILDANNQPVRIIYDTATGLPNVDASGNLTDANGNTIYDANGNPVNVPFNPAGSSTPANNVIGIPQATNTDDTPASVVQDINGNPILANGAPIIYAPKDMAFKIESYGPIMLQIGPNYNQGMEVQIPKINAETLGLVEYKSGKMYRLFSCQALVKTNLTDNPDPNADQNTLINALAITMADDAINIVSTVRSRLGAFQNRLDATIRSLDTAAENTEASRSLIRDTDMAKEMTMYTQYNVMHQASLAILAQANQRPQQIISLLQ